MKQDLQAIVGQLNNYTSSGRDINMQLMRFQTGIRLDILSAIVSS